MGPADTFITMGSPIKGPKKDPLFWPRKRRSNSPRDHNCRRPPSNLFAAQVPARLFPRPPFKIGAEAFYNQSRCLQAFYRPLCRFCSFNNFNFRNADKEWFLALLWGSQASPRLKKNENVHLLVVKTRDEKSGTLFSMILTVCELFVGDF